MRRTALRVAALCLTMGVGEPYASRAQSATAQSATDRHIATLHRTLHITPAQEALWKPLAEAMRRSVAERDRLSVARDKAYGSMNAVDDLKSYGEVQETLASNVRSLIEPFTKLYDSFSPAQKRQADETFRKFTETAARTGR